MANEFIARKGLIVLANGARVTGSLNVQGDINATGYNITASNLALLGSASIDGDVTIGGNITVGNADIDVVKFLAEVSSSIVPDVNNAFDLGSTTKYWKDLYVSGTAYVDNIQADRISGSFYGSGAQLTNIPNNALDNNSVTINAGSGLTDGGTVALGGSVTVSLDTGSATFNDGIKTKLNTEGIFSSSIQTDVRQTTGVSTLATTGSNTFTGVQTINDITNSTNYADGALIVAGGVGIAQNVNISGSLTVLGLLNAVSMSTQYVTSSQYVVGTSRVIVNSNDIIRFGGLSVIDSGSTYGTGSLLWDSFENRWIYQADDQAYNSAIIIAGPKNTGSLGDEVGLIEGRIPVATGDDHIDTNPAFSPLRIGGTTLHAEGDVYVTGSVTASGFAGDGSNLTGIVTNLNITGSQGGTGTVSLKTQGLTVNGINGVAATVSGQTITISGSNATTSSKGVASFDGINFTVAGGDVSSNPINFNGANINLGGTHAFGLQNITPYGASTDDQVSFNGGAVIGSVFFTSGSNIDVDTGTEIVATVSATTYTAAFFDYFVKNGNNYRAGTVMAVWNTAQGFVEYTDTSTNDLGNTSDVIFSVDLLSNTARLKATVASDNWIIKSAVRAL